MALLGPRQVGKTTLAHAAATACEAQGLSTLYLDAESASDRLRLADPEDFLLRHDDRLVILDEIHRLPGIFQTLRGLIDRGIRRGRDAGRFLLLGSASESLLRQSGESLAGRVAYLELAPFDPLEIDTSGAANLDVTAGRVGAAREPNGGEALDRLWVRGGFPRSFLARSDEASRIWRQNLIRTYLERDIPEFGLRVPAETLRRLWTMLAHHHGSPLNLSNIARGLDVSSVTVSRHLDLFTDLLLVRRLAPWSANVRKRLIRTPKVYLRDTGLLHALLGLGDLDELLGNPIVGSSYEGFVIESLINAAPEGAEAFFYRTVVGAEIDLLLRLPGRRLYAIEVKRSLAPRLKSGFHIACADVAPTHRFVVYPGRERYALGQGVTVVSLPDLCREIANL